MNPATSWDDDSQDWDDDDIAYFDTAPDDDEAETVKCPSCNADVYEDADQCPVCGEFIVTDTSIWSDKPWWWIALGLLGIIALIAALVFVG